MNAAPQGSTSRGRVHAIVGVFAAIACVDSSVATEPPQAGSTDISPDAVIVSAPGEPLPEPTDFVDCLSEGRGLTDCALAAAAERHRVLERCLDRESTEGPQVVIRACTFAIHNDLLEGRNRAYLFVNRADAYFKLNHGNWALADYNKAIKLWPRLASLYYNRGVYYATAGDFVRAHADFDSALRLDPKLVPAQRMQGKLLATGH